MRKILLFLLFAGLAFSVTENIDSCTTIDKTGTYYLVSDLEYTGDNNCIKIDASSVTLDCGNHQLLGSYSSTGIRILENEKNIHLKDCKVGFFKYGIYTETGVGSLHLEGLEADSCKEGVSLHEGRDADITDASFTNNNIGLRLDNWAGGEVSNSYFSNRDYGVYVTSSGGYNIISNEFTGSEFGVYTEGFCKETNISGNDFHALVTPVDLYGVYLIVQGNTFHNNAGYAILIRETMNTFGNNYIYGQPLFFAMQSKAFTFTNFTLGEKGTPGSATFGKFSARKPHTTTRFYYFNSTNILLEPEFVSIDASGTVPLSLEDVTVYMEDPEVENEIAVFHAPFNYTTRESVINSGTALDSPVPKEYSPGIMEFILPVFNGSYALGERPPAPEPERYVVVIMLEAPTYAEPGENITVRAMDQDGEPLGGTAIYYFEDPSFPFLAGYTNSEGSLTFPIPSEGAFVIQAKYGDVASQRAISVSEPEESSESLPAPEPEVSPVGEEPAPPEEQPPPAPEEEEEGPNMVFIVFATILVLLVGGSMLGWYLVLRNPPKPPRKSDKEIMHDRLKKFREKKGS
ncbi:MAG: right-handed parallel beta-helix repeat-containing protein [Candidatus Micrarchaeia archaeon]